MKKLLPKNHGFTLIEVIIASVIGAIVFLGVIYFITLINSDISILENKSNVLNAFLNFQNVISKESNKYNVKKILVKNTNGFDVFLLSNNLYSSGMLVGVVNNDEKSSNYLKLDNISNNQIYSDKVLGIKYLNNSDISLLLNNPSNSYYLNFDIKNIYPDFKIVKFSGELFNSGSVIETTIGTIFDYNDQNIGQSINSSNLQDSLYSVNLDL